MFISSIKDIPDWKEYTLIVPAVSVGNVGQLTADLLISTLWMENVGYFYDDCFTPVVGNDPFAVTDTSTNCNIVTAAEVYQSTDPKIVCVQQRSPLIKGKKRQFIDKLFEWIEQNQFKQVVILSSSFAHERTDKQLTGTQLRYLASDEFLRSAEGVPDKNLQWMKLEDRPPNPYTQMITEATNTRQDTSTDKSNIFIPGGGIAKDLYLKCLEAQLPVMLSLIFCSEGDNAIDAIQLATYLNSWFPWVDLKKSQDSSETRGGWKVPSSWKLMFGSSFEQHLFL